MHVPGAAQCGNFRIRPFRFRCFLRNTYILKRGKKPIPGGIGNAGHGYSESSRFGIAGDGIDLIIDL